MHGFRMCAGFFQQEQCHLFSREEYTVPIKWLGSMIVTAMMNGGGCGCRLLRFLSVLSRQASPETALPVLPTGAHTPHPPRPNTSLVTS